MRYPTSLPSEIIYKSLIDIETRECVRNVVHDNSYRSSLSIPFSPSTVPEEFCGGTEGIEEQV